MEELERKKQYAEAWAGAIKALARREHSYHELYQKLKGRFESVLLEEVLEALSQEGLLSDERFAQMLCRSRFNRGAGPVRIRHELKQHQVRGEWIEQAMAEYEGQWVEQLRILQRRKYGETPPVDYAAWAKQARFFQGKGFTNEQIQQAIPRGGD